MMRCALVLVAMLAAACWSAQGGKAAEPRPADPRAQELAASRLELETLRRRLAEVTAERDEAVASRAALEARLRDLELQGAAPPAPAAAARPRPRQPDPAKTYAVALGNWPQRGPADAKVTIVFVHDYTCPYCEKSRATLDDLIRQYGKDLRVVYRPILIRQHQSTPSALAVCAAGRQRMFDPLEPILWTKGFQARSYDVDAVAPDGSTQRCWLTPAGCPIVLGFASEAGLDVRRFKADMPSCETELNDSITELTALGVNATPTFFINGRYLAGAQQIASFTRLIDEEKLKAEERIRRGTPKARYYQEHVIASGERALGP